MPIGLTPECMVTPGCPVMQSRWDELRPPRREEQQVVDKAKPLAGMATVCI